MAVRVTTVRVGGEAGSGEGEAGSGEGESRIGLEPQRNLHPKAS